MRYVLATIALSLLQLTHVGAAENEQPNFVIVIGDDVGWDAFGCTGTPWARTPNIDKLAAQSLQMGRFYCSVSQCAPLRAEMYTGLLPNHNGVLANARKVSRPGVKNVADHLNPLGYRVGWTGKKHFGLGQTKLDNITGFSGGGLTRGNRDKEHDAHLQAVGQNSIVILSGCRWFARSLSAGSE